MTPRSPSDSAMAKAKPVASGRRSAGQSISRSRFQPAMPSCAQSRSWRSRSGVVGRADGADGEGHGHHRIDGDDHHRRRPRTPSAVPRSSTNQPAPSTIGGTTSTKPAPVPATLFEQSPRLGDGAIRQRVACRGERQGERRPTAARTATASTRLVAVACQHGRLARQPRRDRRPGRRPRWRRSARRRRPGLRARSPC